MLRPEPTYEVVNYDTLNAFLLGTLGAIRRQEISIETAQAISQVSDKVIKNNLTRILDAKRTGNTDAIEFFETRTAQVMIT